MVAFLEKPENYPVDLLIQPIFCFLFCLQDSCYFCFLNEVKKE